MDFLMGQSYERLNEASKSMLELVSEYIGTNTFCVTQTSDNRHSILTHVFNRNTIQFNAGDSLFLEDAYWGIILSGGRDPLVINDTSLHPVACNLIPTTEMGVKSFLGIPIVLSNGAIFGDLCALDIKQYTFTEKEIRFLKTMAVFLAHTIELDTIAHQDQLTGLNNRQFLKQYINTLPIETEVAILFIDVDGFKSVNDTYGHKDGDSVLVQVAERIKECVKSQDILCRYGGDEFVILSQGDDNARYSRSLSESIINQFGKPFLVKDDEIALSVSIGISMETSKHQNIDQLVEKADHAMYNSKNNGKNRYTYFNEVREK